MLGVTAETVIVRHNPKDQTRCYVCRDAAGHNANDCPYSAPHQHTLRPTFCGEHGRLARAEFLEWRDGLSEVEKLRATFFKTVATQTTSEPKEKRDAETQTRNVFYPPTAGNPLTYTQPTPDERPLLSDGEEDATLMEEEYSRTTARALELRHSLRAVRLRQASAKRERERSRRIDEVTEKMEQELAAAERRLQLAARRSGSE